MIQGIESILLRWLGRELADWPAPGAPTWHLEECTLRWKSGVAAAEATKTRREEDIQTNVIVQCYICTNDIWILGTS